MISSRSWKAGKRNGARLRDDDGFRLRAAGICVRLSESGRDVLLVSGGKDGDRWVVPGGGIECGETPEEAALREVHEEAGVRAQALTHLGLFQVSQFYSFDHLVTTISKANPLIKRRT